MVLRSGVRQILKLPRLQGHVSSNGHLPRINHYRLAGSAGVPSTDHTVSTEANTLGVTTVMVQSDIKGTDGKISGTLHRENTD
jgi:hypothetical protein